VYSLKKLVATNHCSPTVKELVTEEIVNDFLMNFEPGLGYRIEEAEEAAVDYLKQEAAGKMSAAQMNARFNWIQKSLYKSQIKGLQEFNRFVDTLDSSF
jgi:hypothetical protein